MLGKGKGKVDGWGLGLRDMVRDWRAGRGGGFCVRVIGGVVCGL